MICHAGCATLALHSRGVIAAHAVELCVVVYTPWPTAVLQLFNSALLAVAVVPYRMLAPFMPAPCGLSD